MQDAGTSEYPPVLGVGTPADDVPIPQTVLQSAYTDPGWLTQPLATVIAGLLAIGAASIAYRGIRLQVRTQAIIADSRQAAEDVRARKQSESDDTRAQMQHRLALAFEGLTEATSLVGRLSEVAAPAKHPGSMNVDQTGRLKGWYDECKLCSAKLHLLGMSDAEQKLMDAARYPMAAIEEYYEEGGLGLDPEDLNKLRSAALDAFRREYLDF